MFPHLWLFVKSGISALNNMFSGLAQRSSLLTRSIGLSLGFGISLFPLSLIAQSQPTPCGGTNLLSTATQAQTEALDKIIAEIPFTTGLYWRATRNGQVIDIIGTLHLNDSRFDTWMPTLQRDLETAQLMLVESNQQDLADLQSALTTDPSLAFIQSGPDLIDRLPPTQWQHIKEAAQAAGIPSAIAAKMKPWFLVISLSVPHCLRTTPHATRGLDIRLMERATGANIPVQSLEDPRTVYALLDEEPLEKQLADLGTYLHLLSPSMNDLQTLKDSYFDQDVQRAITFQERRFWENLADADRRRAIEDIEDLNTALIAGRNHAWMKVIQTTNVDHLMIAVGAAHLPGTQGLLSLLKNKGYTLTRKALP